jgi:hypothetical protein
MEYAPNPTGTQAGCRVVDYGRDIADLAQIVSALQRQVAMLHKRIDDIGATYGSPTVYGMPTSGFENY